MDADEHFPGVRLGTGAVPAIKAGASEVCHGENFSLHEDEIPLFLSSWPTTT